jgi:hypothetical protein
LTPPFSTRILPTLKEKLEIKFIFFQNKGFAYLCFENQFEHLEKIFKKKEKMQCVEKNTMQMCK